MEGYGRGEMKWRNKFCSGLIVSLLIGGAWFLTGEAASSSGTEDGYGSEIKSAEETENSGTEATEPETVETESSVEETKERETPDQNDSEQETSNTEESQTDIRDLETQETGTYESENMETEAEELPDTEEIMCLQLPEKLEIIIDPWEIDGKGQVHSEPFTVKNTGELSGMLTLSFTCKVNGREGVTVRETREGLHDSGEKLIYMKVILENGEEAGFTEEGAQCQAQLQPGEELALRFEGEVNENTEEPWKNGDVEIEGTYVWEEEEVISGEDEGTDSETEAVPEEDILTDETGEDVSGKEENSPVETEKETFEKEENSPAETEKETSGEEEIPPTETDKETSDREEALPAGTEKKNSDEEETLPAEMEKKISDEENILSGRSEKGAIGGNRLPEGGQGGVEEADE